MTSLQNTRFKFELVARGKRYLNSSEPITVTIVGDVELTDPSVHLLDAVASLSAKLESHLSELTTLEAVVIAIAPKHQTKSKKRKKKS